MATIAYTSMNFTREPLKKAFGFKGDSMDELWQVVSYIRLSDGVDGLGVGVQSVLWADSETFATYDQAGCNAMMLATTDYALSCLNGKEFTNPQELIHKIYTDVYSYAKKCTCNDMLPATFVLDALVSVDFALWQIWAKENNVECFESIFKDFTSYSISRQNSLCSVPLISYNTTDEELVKLLEDGSSLLKIKIGSNPDGDNNLDKMVIWDTARVRHIHEIASQYNTMHTESGKPAYYLDANGRYDTQERLMKFIDGISCLASDVLILEEPYDETLEVNVSAIPFRVAGDESIHSKEDAIHRIEDLGYGAVALKPIAKTLSNTLEILDETSKRGIPCFCADLTIPPVMLEWNMSIASRLTPIPGMRTGILESNGKQNYVGWDRLLEITGHPHGTWLHSCNGIFNLRDFYERCNVMDIPEHYLKLVKR